jgi:hypothetical protein
MSKLQLFRIIGESFARAHEFSDSGHIGTRKVDRTADRFFAMTADEMYPNNKHRNEWAASNMRMFYIQEFERIQIMQKLRHSSKGRATTLDAIRKR